ncbi:hypothetical protein HPC49_54855, partial [Pyxidicoccus fallax]
VVAALAVAYGTGTLYLMVFPVLSAYHFGAVLLALVALPLALRTFRGGSRLAPWLLGAVCFLANASDSLFFVIFTAPAAVCFLLLALAWRPVPWRRLGILLGILGVAMLLGFRAARWLTHKRAGAGYTSLKLELALESLQQLGVSVAEQARRSPGFAALWVLVTLAAVAVLVMRRRQWTAPDSPLWGVYAVCLFGVLALGANVGAVVLAGLFGDQTCFRYLVLPLLFPFLGLSLAAGLVPR